MRGLGRLRYRLSIAAGAARLGSGRWMQAKIFCLCMAAPLRDRTVGPRDVTLDLSYGRLRVPWVVGPTSDFDVLYEVLVKRIYERGLPSTAPKLILDLGSHFGAAVLFFHERFPAARIVAVEPDPTTFRRLQRNVGHLPNVELRAAAVTSVSGPVSFFPARQAWLSSLEGEGRPVAVEGVTLDDLISELGPVDLLKIDIEGAEREVLAGSTQVAQLNAIVGEFHDSGDPGETEKFFELLRDVNLTVEGGAGNFAACRRP